MNTNSQKIFKERERILLFDLSLGGHHPSYLLYLIEYWCESQLAGKIDIVVLPKFFQQHQEVVAKKASYQNTNINFVPISPQEETSLKGYNSSFSRTWRAFQEWRIFCKYARLLKTTHGLLMYFDRAQVPLLIKKPPCPISGIYFRPTFHYANFAHNHFSLAERLQTWREIFTLNLIFRHSQLQNIFCLDPLAIEPLQRFNKGVKAISLADPVKVYSPTTTSNSLRKKHNISPDKKVFLLFGAITRRKGIYQLLEAIPLLEPKLLEQMCLLLVGSFGKKKAQKEYLQNELSRLTNTSEIQIMIRDEFIPEIEIQDYFLMSDVILALYQRHVGMSGILNRAAISQTPVLSSNYGLMGELTRRYGLGIAIDSTNAQEVARSLRRCLIEPPKLWSDINQMNSFTKHNSAEKFAQVIFNYL